MKKANEKNPAIAPSRKFGEAECDLGTCNRDLIQYVLYDRAAREAQLEGRRLAVMQGVVQ